MSVDTTVPRDPTAPLRGAVSIASRELVRFWRNRLRIVSSLVQPVLFLFVLGTGLSPMMGGDGDAVSFRVFLFPGIIGMTLLFSGLFSAMSVVWDREFGFLREMMVAPISAWAITLGKCLGGALVATAQALLLLALAPVAGVRLGAVVLAALVPQILLIALAFTALGVAIATFVEKIESFPLLSQFVVLPMFFLSSAFFPVTNLPSWMTAIALANPMSYAVDALRRTALSGLEPTSTLGAGIAWGGRVLPVGIELLLVGCLGAVALSIGIARLCRVE